MTFDELGDRMKQYENVSDYYLPERIPIILRLDGRSFHTITKVGGFHKPFDIDLHKSFIEIASSLLNEIQGSRFAYSQSDEISILIYQKNVLSQPWFGNRLSKMVSVSASTASSIFNMKFPNRFKSIIPTFDARAFAIPAMEVENYFIWRQQDAIRNSIFSWARCFFSQKELHGKSTVEMKEMLNDVSKWETIDFWMQRGSVILHDNASYAPHFVTEREWFKPLTKDPIFEKPKSADEKLQ